MKTQLIQPDATMASPMWWGADSLRSRIEYAGGTAFVKQMQPFAKEYVDLDAAFSAARAAGEAGIGPRVYSSDRHGGVLVMEDLGATHRTANLTDFTPDTAAALIELRKQVSNLHPGAVRLATVFDDIRTLRGKAEALRVLLPADLPWMLRFLEVAEAAINASGFDLAFCHGDGNVSNVLVGQDGAPALVDWDWAALMDPLQDLGATLAEVTFFGDDAKELFEQYWGSFDAGLFERARLYGMADAVRFGLVGALVDALDPGTYEYSKFSDWQFLRARTWLNIAEARADDPLRLV
jgi:thiamine kinase-like enzyme